MSQRLILPIMSMRVEASYKNTKYAGYFGYKHYGLDATSRTTDKKLYSPGEGEVIACGLDGTSAATRLGNCIVIVYKDVLCNDGKTRNLACRMFHLESIAVKAGQKLTAGQLLGVYGNTGANSTGPHLHIEFDTDIQWPQYAVGIASSGNVIKKGTTDSTVNPSFVWFLSSGQSITQFGGGWTEDRDVAIPKAPAGTGTPPVTPGEPEKPPAVDNPANSEEIARLKDEIAALTDEIKWLDGKLDKIRELVG